jgi:DNA-binding NarL/FixJ family response regulator
MGSRRLDEFTNSEREVLALAAEGLSNHAICDRLTLGTTRRGPYSGAAQAW